MTEFKYINVIYDDSSDDNLTLTPNSVPDDENNSFGNVAWPFPSTTTHLLQIVLMIIYSLQATIGNKIPFTIWEDPEESMCNAVILKGGKESIATLNALYSSIKLALSETAIPQSVIQLVETREEIKALLDLDRYIDLVIPRGSNSLVRYIQENTRIPVLGHADGLCTVYVDKDSDLKKAIRVVIDSKINYPAACNAAETLLIHRGILSTHLQPIINALLEANVKLHLDHELLPYVSHINNNSLIEVSVPEDFDTEFLNLEIAVKVVNGLEEAIQHINIHCSKHTDSIVTENETAAKKFMQGVDSAGVYWNASTRFADGFRYGFGAEVGVSTNKTHARGPVGLEGLVIYKYKLCGNGHIVGEFANPTYSADTVFLSSPVPLKALKTKPTITTCPHCKAIVLSRTKFKSGSATLLSSLGLFLVGLTSCCCCLFPFCINDLKDCVHSCPNCGKVMAKYSRLEGKAHIK
ncbi:2396_t:CDS:2 [Entrophospora sp. SA101]|nr:2396_t:CDS:2 [Entrophospora sp. SA101]